MEINLADKTPDIRYLSDMQDVLYDQEWAQTAPNIKLYYMYRKLSSENGIKYDITIIPAQMLGKEFNKTKGHQHLGDYQEIYTVIEGEAIYLMQKQKDNIIEDVFAVKAKQGDVVIIPAGYSHITINPSTKDLKMADWIAIGAKSDYEEIKKKKGACYFYTTDGWIKNENYEKVPELRFEEPRKEVPKDLSFLKN